MKAAYFSKTGRELSGDATKVELLPPGVTFAPTVTPAPLFTPAPAGFLPIVADLDSSENPSPDASPEPPVRTKATRYEENPLGDILEPFIGQIRDNADIAGQLSLDGLIGETVMMRNNTYYLTHRVDGSFSESGAAFLDEGCQIRRPPENLHVRGQSTVEGRVFAPLWFYASEGVSFAQQHALIRMDTLYEQAQYILFAVIETGGSRAYFNYGGYPSFQTDAQMLGHVEQAKALSRFDIPIDVLPSDRLLTLSTIHPQASDRVLVLLARRLRPGESIASFGSALASMTIK